MYDMNKSNFKKPHSAQQQYIQNNASNRTIAKWIKFLLLWRF